MATVEELMNDKEFCEKLVRCENEDAVKTLFSENGATIDDERAKAMHELFSTLKGKFSEFSDDELAQASGGADPNYPAVAVFGAGSAIGAGLTASSIYDLAKDIKNKTKSKSRIVADAAKLIGSAALTAAMTIGLVDRGLGFETPLKDKLDVLGAQDK